MPETYVAVDIVPRDLNLFIVVESVERARLPYCVSNASGFAVRVVQQTMGIGGSAVGPGAARYAF